MTLLVVHRGTVYIDSCCVVGEHGYTTSKLEMSSFGPFGIAGNVERGLRVMKDLERRGDLFVEVDGGDPDHTVIALRNTTDGKIYFMDLGDTKAQMAPICKPHSNGVSFMAGSGWRFFHAYLLEHNDVATALSLTAAHCRDVDAPFEWF